MDILTLAQVSKSFGNHKVIENLSFSVPEHTIFGFIGQNGAGKTTTLKIILGLQKCDSGSIFVNGKPVHFGQNQTNKYIGYLPDVPEFYDFMTPLEYLKLCGNITEMSKDKLQQRIQQLLELVGLTSVNKPIRGFSRGMKQRLGIAQALLNHPKLLICDEPTSALDPIGRKEILDILVNIKQETTILFSTHILSDVERICDRIALLHNGKIAFCKSLEEIKSLHKNTQIEIEFFRTEDANLFAKKYKKTQPINNTKLLCEQQQENDIVTIMDVLVQNNLSIQRLEILEPSLETMFMEVICK